MASMRDIKRRKQSVSSTQQITKAMKLVSTVKLQKARSKAEQTTPYFNAMYNTICGMLAKAGTVNNKYLRDNGSKKIGVIVITSNRGLAGGYNSNIVKMITGSDMDPSDVKLYVIGHKGGESLAHKGYEVVKDYSPVMEAPTYADAIAISNDVLKFEKALFDLVDTKYPEIPESIRTTKVLEGEMEEKLIKAIEECKKDYK